MIKEQGYEETEMKPKNSFIDYLKYVPIIYPLLVFLGYLNYDFYYKRFDIDIFIYLNINEFLFSFVSLVYPVIFLLLFYVSYTSYQHLLNNAHMYSGDGFGNKNVEQNSNQNKKFIPTLPYISFYKNQFRKAKIFRYKREFDKWLGFNLLGVLCFILYHIAYLLPFAIIGVGFFLAVAPLSNILYIKEIKIENLGWFDTPNFLLRFTIGWYVIFALYLSIRVYNEKMSRNSFRSYLISITFMLIISTLIRYQNIRSHNITYKKAENYVCFNYENNNIESSENIKLLGMTSEYLFLRNILTKTNYIYKLSDVKNLMFRSIDE